MSDTASTNHELIEQLLSDGHASFDAGDFMKALEHYHRASLLDAHNAAAWIALGLTFSNLDFPREAWRSYLLALSADSSNTDALWYASEFLFEIEDLALADLFLRHYLSLEKDAQRLTEARQLQAEIRAETASRGIALAEERGVEAEAMLSGEESSKVSDQLDEETQGEYDEEELEYGLSDEELELQALDSERFIPPLSLRLSGFEGSCPHCGLHIPYDAPYCWSCKMIHFYE